MPRSQSTMTVISLGTAGASSPSNSTVGSIQARLYAKFRGSNGCHHVGTPPLVAGVGGFFHYPPPTLMSRNFRLPCTIELQPLSLTPLKMRKVEPGAGLGGAPDAPGHGNGATPVDHADDDGGGLVAFERGINDQGQPAGTPPYQDPPEQWGEAETYVQFGLAGTGPVAAVVQPLPEILAQVVPSALVLQPQMVSWSVGRS